MERSVLRTLTEVQEWFSNNSVRKIALDTETTALRYSELKIEGISIYNGENACYIDLIDNHSADDIIDIVKEQLTTVTKVLICHNAVFDLKVLYKYDIKLDHVKLYDTMIADHLLDENRRHGLKHLAKDILGHDTESYAEVEKLGHQSKTFYQYAINDAVWTWELMEWQQEPMKEQGLANLFRQIEMPFQFVLLDMQVNGVHVDKKKLEEYRNILSGKLLDLECSLHDELELDYEMQADLFGNLSIVTKHNFNSTQFLSHILFDKLGLEPVEKTPNGVDSVGKKTIYTYKDENDIVQKIYQHKKYSKLLHAFVESLPGFIEADGKIRPSMLDHGTRTGRLSCRDPNLQQLPKAEDGDVSVRSCITVAEDEVMITCDYSGQELRVLSEITQEPVLIDTFNKGKDMHLSTANDFFDLDIPEEALYESNPDFDIYKKRFKSERDKAKVINFGMAYGKGAYGFSKDFNISEEEAEGLLQKYFAALPKVRDSIERCHTDVREQGFICTLTGRRRRFVPDDKGYYPGSALRQSFNFLIQGFSADMIRIAANKTYKLKEQHPEWNLKFLFTVHDEIAYSVKKEYEQEAMQAIKENFENAVKFCIPIVADVSSGRDYNESK